jgi:hypothetical protein
LQSLFATFDKLNVLLAVLTYLLPTTSIQITEFIDQKQWNILRRKNLHMLIGKMFMLTKYHKMISTTWLDICVPAFHPEPLPLRFFYCILVSQLLFSLSFFFFERAHFVCIIICINNLIPFFPFTDSYLWVQNGQWVTLKGFSYKFEEMMGKYCGCKLKPSLY